jgi:hypothetical protein
MGVKLRQRRHFEVIISTPNIVTSPDESISLIVEDEAARGSGLDPECRLEGVDNEAVKGIWTANLTYGQS